MNTVVKNKDVETRIFAANDENFNALALEIFRFQYQNNSVYRAYCDAIRVKPADINSIRKIPFLPISFFKTHRVTSTEFVPEVIFESSGTTQTINSKHLVKRLDLYQSSFNKTFELFYGSPNEWCILALLPSYLERKNSSLVLMAEELIKASKHPESGFYLNEFDQLSNVLQQLEQAKQKTLLIGVTFALLDFAAAYPMQLNFTTIMETGGMKGRKQEMTRQEVHAVLSEAFQTNTIHSEYGMTELLSQAYSNGNGIFKCPPWMKILVREEDDPFEIKTDTEKIITGAINVIDLANIYSCSFIATEDAGKLYSDGSFEVLGRLDNSDIRGCSLLAL